ANRLADLYFDGRQVRIACGQTIAVVDFDHLAVASIGASMRYGAGRRRAYRVSGLAPHVEAGMHGRTFQKWIQAHAESGRIFDFAVHGLAYRYSRQSAVETFHMCARKVDPMKLPL